VNDESMTLREYAACAALILAVFAALALSPLW